VAREERLDELETVVEEQRNAVARADAARDERAGEAIGPRVELSEALPLAPGDERRPVRVQTRAATEELGKYQPARTLECLMPIQILDSSPLLTGRTQPDITSVQ
jgi:hypothetical protein